MDNRFYLYICVFILLIYLFITTRRTIIVSKPSRVEPDAPSWKITTYNGWSEWIGYPRPFVPSPHSTTSHARPWGGSSRHANASAPPRTY